MRGGKANMFGGVRFDHGATVSCLQAASLLRHRWRGNRCHSNRQIEKVYEAFALTTQIWIFLEFQPLLLAVL